MIEAAEVRAAPRFTVCESSSRFGHGDLGIQRSRSRWVPVVEDTIPHAGHMVCGLSNSSGLLGAAQGGSGVTIRKRRTATVRVTDTIRVTTTRPV